MTDLRVLIWLSPHRWRWGFKRCYLDDTFNVGPIQICWKPKEEDND